MRLKRKPDEEDNPDRARQITKRGKPKLEENPPQREDLEDIRYSSKHRQSRKGKTPRKRRGKAQEL